MFSLTRPSPAMKCASSSSLSYSVGPLPGLPRPIVMSPSAILPIGTASCAMSARKAWPVRMREPVGRVRRAAPGVPETTTSSAVFGMPSTPMPVMTCAKPVAFGNEVAVLIGSQQGHAADVEVGQLDAQHVRACALTSPQVAMPPLRAFDQLAGRDRLAIGVELVLAQEHLVRGMRGVGLVLVDERGRGVDRPDIVGRAHDAVGARQTRWRASAP